MTHLSTEKKLARQQAWLTAFSRFGVVAEACRATGISKSCYDVWAREDEDFNAMRAEAFEVFKASLLTEAITRGRDGWREPVVHQGSITYMRNWQTGDFLLDENFERIPVHIVKKSDRMLELLLKRFDPAFRDKAPGVSVGFNQIGPEGDGEDKGSNPWVINVHFLKSDGAGNPAEGQEDILALTEG